MTPVEEARQAVVVASQNLNIGHRWLGTREELEATLDGACRTLVQLLDATPGPR
jgi:hypothetical protein